MSAPVNQTDPAAVPPADGLSYQDALVAAAALRAAASAPNPADVVAWASEQIAAVRGRTTEWATAAILRLWRGVNPYDERQVAKFGTEAAEVMGTAQAAVGRAAAAGQVRQLAALGIRVDGVPSLPINVRAPAAVVENGKLALRHHAVNVDYADGGSKRVKAADMTTEARPKPVSSIISAARSSPSVSESICVDTAWISMRSAIACTHIGA